MIMVYFERINLFPPYEDNKSILDFKVTDFYFNYDVHLDLISKHDS